MCEFKELRTFCLRTIQLVLNCVRSRTSSEQGVNYTKVVGLPYTIVAVFPLVFPGNDSLCKISSRPRGGGEGSPHDYESAVTMLWHIRIIYLRMDACEIFWKISMRRISSPYRSVATGYVELKVKLCEVRFVRWLLDRKVTEGRRAHYVQTAKKNSFALGSGI